MKPAVVVNVERPDVEVHVGGERINVYKPAEIFIVSPMSSVPARCHSFELESGELIAVRLTGNLPENKLPEGRAKNGKNEVFIQ